jgi:hydroxyacylglutathione hydrolase
MIERINLGFVNCYLIKTDNGFVLIDTGIPALRKKLIHKLSLAGCNNTNLKLIIITHGDIDHTGNCKYLKEKYNPQIAMHKNDLLMVEKGEFNSARKITSKLMKFIMRTAGGETRMTATFEKFTPDIFLDDGYRLEAYGLDCEVMHIPGHTDGSIGLLFSNGYFICGDTLQNNKPAVIIKNEEELQNSIEKLSKRKLTIIYPGHGNPFPWNGIKK